MNKTQTKKFLKNKNRVDFSNETEEIELEPFDPKRLDRKNYNRDNLAIIAKYNMPFILTAVYTAKTEKHCTFTEVKPYLSRIAPLRISQLCDHINIKTEEIEKYAPDIQENDKVFLICEAKYYINRYNEKRYGVVLSKELYCNPIVYSLGRIKMIPQHLYLDLMDLIPDLNIKIDKPYLKHN